MATRPITQSPPEDIPMVQRMVSVLWPSFLTAALAPVLFFALFDPKELAALRNLNEMSRLAGYTLGFFSFWLLTSLSSALTCYFRRPCHEPVERDFEDEAVEQQ